MKKKAKKAEKQFVEIDLLALDQEWVDQPRYYKDFAYRLADANLDLAEKKAELKLVSAEILNAMRREPERFGIKKPSETAFDNLLPLQKEYQHALREVHQAEHTVDLLKAAVNTLEHKKKALENLVQLEGRNYFASPRTTEYVGRERAAKAARNSARQPLDE